MIVLEKHRIVKTESMRYAAPALHGVLLQHAKTRERLARVENFRGGSVDCIDVRPSDRRRCAREPEQVQQHALDAENRVQRPFNSAEYRASLNARSVAKRAFNDAHSRNPLRKQFDDPDSRERHGFPCSNNRAAEFRGIKGERARDVLKCTILRKREVDHSRKARRDINFEAER